MPGGRGKKKQEPSSGSDAIKAPDRKRYEEDVEAVMNVIKEKNVLLKNIQKPPSERVATNSPDVSAELKQVNALKKGVLEKIQEIDKQMKDLAKQVTTKRDHASQLMAGLQYRSEERFDLAISKLREQLHKMEYTPTEEKRLRLEVENLQKAKESLKEYLSLKQAIDELRDQQTELRKKRDDHYKEENVLKQQETACRERQAEVRKKQNELREKAKEEAAKRDELRKEIDQLYDKRRQLVSDFRQQQEDYLAITREQRIAERAQRQEQAKRKEEQRQARQRERAAMVPQDPYQHEKFVITTLTNYLQRLASTITTNHLNTSSSTSSIDSADDEHTLQKSSARWDGSHAEGSFLQRKSDLEDSGPTAGGRRKSKREKKRGTAAVKSSKLINHTTTVFDQFHLLDIKAPATYADIPSTIASLQAKLSQFNQTKLQVHKEPSEVDSQITDDELSHTTEEMLLDDNTTEDIADSGTCSPSKPDLVGTNS
ncbi:uncharacterized protein [Dysidea avara]|uniref:uncharacterized protein n=1 Tax=Dysidea avara TaxID=196820 RepID=UPI0033318EBE